MKPFARQVENWEKGRTFRKPMPESTKAEDISLNVIIAKCDFGSVTPSDVSNFIGYLAKKIKDLEDAT